LSTGRPWTNEVAAVDQHLADCDPCLRYPHQMRATVAALGMVPTEQVTETLSDQAVTTPAGSLPATTLRLLGVLHQRRAGVQQVEPAALRVLL
jgi:hypothetical protein